VGGAIEVNSKDHESRMPLASCPTSCNSKDKGGLAPLSLAASNGKETVVQLLLKRKDVEVNSKDKDGLTPLSWAAFNGKEAVVQLLLKREDVEVSSKYSEMVKRLFRG
jgi:ankyrin repeat protein